MQKKKMLQEFLGHRFLVFALFMLIFSGGLKAAEEEYQKKKISVQIVNETIEQALNKIGNIADIRFFYNHASFDFSKKININITDKELRDAIGQVLAGYAVDVEYQPNRTVVLRPRKELPAHDVQKISGVVNRRAAAWSQYCTEGTERCGGCDQHGRPFPPGNYGR